MEVREDKTYKVPFGAAEEFLVRCGWSRESKLGAIEKRGSKRIPQSNSLKKKGSDGAGRGWSL